jgi:hypothetical protein
MIRQRSPGRADAAAILELSGRVAEAPRQERIETRPQSFLRGLMR